MDYNEFLQDCSFSSPEEVAEWIGGATKAIVELQIKVKATEQLLNKAERERDAAVKELDGVAAAVDYLSDFIDYQIHPLVQYDMYLTLREHADAISIWQHENEWRGQKEE